MKLTTLVHGGSYAGRTLCKDTISRIEKAADLYQAGLTDRIVFNALCGTVIEPDGKRNGLYIEGLSKDMYFYARMIGIPDSVIVVRNLAKDTVSEALFFNKQDNPDRGNYFFITSDWHLKRTKTIHDYMHTQEQKAIPIGVKSNYAVPENEEYWRVQRFLRTFGREKRGDLSALEERLYREHELFKR